MKRNKTALILSSIALALGVASFAGVKSNKKTVVTFAGYQTDDAATYYNGIGESSTGDSLLSALRSLNGSKKKENGGYDELLTGPTYAKYLDYDINTVQYDDNGRPYSNKIVSFYSGNLSNGGAGMNREHVWPNSRGGSGVENDSHMARPTLTAENSSRGNSFYVEGKNSTTSGWDPAMPSFGDSSYRGDSARIIFYCVVANNNLSLIDAENDSASNKTMGKLSDLLRWNIDNPVQQRERNRNEGVEYIQGNRNPFIDHPEYACRIWGNTNSTTKNICANAVYPTVDHTIGIRTDDGYNTGTSNIGAYTLTVDSSANFFAFVDSVQNASVSWELSDNNVATSTYYGRGSYTNGVTITGVEAGTTTLTVRYNYQDNGEQKSVSATCDITVKNSGGSGEGGGTADDVENIQTATYTVSTKDSVSTSGTVPTGSSASYSQTYSTAGQCTSGKEAELVLSGYDGKVITGVTLNMHSNGSSGAGKLNIDAGSTSLASTSGSFSSWYDSTGFSNSWQDIHVELTNSSYIINNDEDVTINITGTTNSLYIKSFTITYGDPKGSGGEEDKTLESVVASGMTQSYEVGDNFSFDGTLTAHYSNNSEKEVTPTSVSTPDMSSSGNKTVTVSYTEDGTTVSTTYTIYVAPKSAVLTSISLSGQRTTYIVGDEFSFTGTCTAHYDDQNEQEVTPTSVSTPDMSTPGNKTITVSYTEKGVTKTETYTITVNQRVLSKIEVTTDLTNKTQYVGGTFNSTGLVVTATYDNNTTKEVTSACTVSAPDMTSEGNNKEVGISYTENGVTRETSTTINIVSKPDTLYYEKVKSSEDIADGDYLIVYETAKKALNGGLSSYDVASNTIPVTIDNDIIEANETVDAAKFTINRTSNSIKGTSGKYIGVSSYSNGINSSSTAIANSFSIDSNGNALISVSTSGGTMTLKFNDASDQLRFRYYKSGQKSIQLYKYNGEGSGGDEEPVLTDISVSTAPTKTEYEVGDTFDPTGLVITRTYSSGPSDTYSYAGHESEFHFSPNLDTELTTSNTSVTIYYGGKNCSQSISVSSSGGDIPVIGGDATYVASEQGYSNEQVVTSFTFDNSNISGVFNKGTGSGDPKYYNTGAAIRLYAGGYFTVTSAKKNISKIVLSFGTGDKSNAITADKGSYSNGTWTSATGTYEKTVTFTVGGTKDHRRIAGIAVTYYSISTFASDFLAGTGCDSSGKTAPSVNWTTMNNKFDLLFDDEQLALKKAEASESGSIIEQAVARYDYIVGKYGTSTYNDFINRNPDPIPNGMSVLSGHELSDNNMMIIMIIVSLISASSLTTLLIIKKKKHR